MKLKATVIICILFILAASINAETMVDVVHLENGSIIKGDIIENIPNERIKIETSDGSLFVYEMSKVEKISKERIQNDSNKEDLLFEIESAFSGNMSMKEIANIEILREDLKQLSRYERKSIYNIHKKDRSTLGFVLNFFLPFGVGSYVQGDVGMGAYKTVSDILFLVAVATESEVLAIPTGINFAAASVTSWIRPFTYETRYNSLLGDKLNL